MTWEMVINRHTTPYTITERVGTCKVLRKKNVAISCVSPLRVPHNYMDK